MPRITRKKKPRRGRPPGPPENVRRCLFLVRLTDAELAMFREAAKATDESVADWGRRLLLAACQMSGIKDRAK